MSTRKQPPKRSLWSRATEPGAKHSKETFEELPDFLFWLRVALGVLLGIIWGLVPQLQGFIGLILYAGVSTIVIYVYLSVYTKTNIESYSNTGGFELLTEGMQQSLGAFVICWCITFTKQQELLEEAV